ncbi:flagellar basal body P-ring formation chaperone FlgA [Henriciella sp. AS95]|uniref:flagellar basal body P-ring formation chaperone FlgA n=1 Tax=Henriciella sp. AS95 TaxID=3135782 RepID=UPI0031706F0E
MAMFTSLVSGAVLAFAGAQSVVATDVIRAGDVVMPEMVSTEDGGMVADSPVIGREVRRTVYAGQEIRLDNTQAPRLVTRNQLVTVKYIRGGLEITTTGRAMSEGAQNDAVTVLNLQSRKMVNGVVQAEGWVLAQ